MNRLPLCAPADCRQNGAVEAPPLALRKPCARQIHVLNQGPRDMMVLRTLLIFICALGAQPAKAACDAANRYTLDWDAQATGTISKAVTTNFAANNPLGASQTIGVSFGGDTADISTVTGITTPYIGVVNTGGLPSATTKTLSIGTIFQTHATDIDSNTDVVSVTFSFAAPVRDVTFTVLDIDYTANQFSDWIKISGSFGSSTYVPAITGAYGNNNSAAPGLATTPSVTWIGPATAYGFALVSGQIFGDGASSATQDYGNVTASFAQPVTAVTLRYANGPGQITTGAVGQQMISIHDISFCPMPAVSVAKTSTPFVTAAGDPRRFALPDSDMIYALTVTNTGGSPIDAGGLQLIDLLPPQLRFYNGDIDDAGPLTGPYEFIAGTSGLSFGSANASYSNSGGASYGYTPVAGYDPAVNALRLVPVGSMAANSSFTIRFRARIN
jgi:uncharacterized repeat protein (TIGR01451 family)